MGRPVWLILTFSVVCPALWPQTVSVAPSNVSGVEILEAQAPQASPYVDQILGPIRSELLNAWLPYGVVLRNCSAQPLMAVAVRWEVTGPDGRIDKVVMENTAWDQSAYRLPPGKNVVVLPVLVLSDGSRLPASSVPGSGKLPGFQSAQSIKVNLDGVVFPSGQFVGPDIGHEFERGVAYTTVPPQVAAKVLEMKTTGVPIADIAAWLQTTSAPVRRWFATRRRYPLSERRWFSSPGPSPPLAAGRWYRRHHVRIRGRCPDPRTGRREKQRRPGSP